MAQDALCNNDRKQGEVVEWAQAVILSKNSKEFI